MLRDQAIQFAEARRDATLELSDLVEQLAVQDSVIAFREAAVAEEIATTVDDAGKARFSSEDKRKAELVRRRSADKELFGLHFDARKLRQKIDHKQAEITLLRDKVRILTAFAGAEE